MKDMYKALILVVLIFVSGYAFEATAASYRVVTNNAGTQFLEITGSIEENETARMIGWLNRNPKVSVVALASTGGLTGEGWKMARKIRDRKLDTFAVGECASACTQIFMGGIDRAVGKNGSLRFHYAFVMQSNAEWSANDMFAYGQQTSYQMIRHYLAYVPNGKEWPALVALQETLDGTSRTYLRAMSRAHMLNSGIATRVLGGN